MNANIIVTMGFIAIGTAVTEKVCDSFGKGDIGRYVSVAGTSLVGISAIALAFQLLNKVKEAFGG
jgi:hypothetical protein